MRFGVIVGVLCVGVCVAACDDKKPTQRGEENSGGGIISRLLPDSFPKDVRSEYLEYPGQLWLDFIFNHGCVGSEGYGGTGVVRLFYKDSAERWPSVSEDGDIAAKLNRNVLIDYDTEKVLKDRFVTTLIQRGVIGTKPIEDGVGRKFTCFSLFTDKIGKHYSSYHRNSDRKETRGIISLGTLVFDQYQKISEFEKPVPFSGMVAKHQKYKLFAHIQENELLGGGKINMERTIVIYFDAEDQVWREEKRSFIQRSTTPWHLASGNP